MSLTSILLVNMLHHADSVIVDNALYVGQTTAA